MPEIDVDLYCEDIDQEALLVPLIERVAAEHSVQAIVHPRSTRGGKGKVREQVVAFLKILREHAAGASTPDLLVVAVDANSYGAATVRAEVASYVDMAVIPRLAIACPDPHIERWYLGDTALFARLFGVDANPPPDTTSQDAYKAHLKKLLLESDVELLLGPHELGPDIAQELDLYSAGKADPGFKSFIDEVRGACKDVSS